MGTRNQVVPAFEKVLIPPAAQGSQALVEADLLDVSVIFTSPGATIAALKKAGALAAKLNARITLVVPQIVPFPAPLTTPPVLLDFQEMRLRAIAEASPVDVTVRIYLCRERWDALIAALKPHSLVVLASRRKWWRTREMRLATRLRKAGHEVIVTEMEVAHA
jgi:hypothetical protein